MPKLKKVNFSGNKEKVFKAISDIGPTSIKSIMEVTGLSMLTVRKYVFELSDSGFVSAVKDTSRRASPLVISIKKQKKKTATKKTVSKKTSVNKNSVPSIKKEVKSIVLDFSSFITVEQADTLDKICQKDEKGFNKRFSAFIKKECKSFSEK